MKNTILLFILSLSVSAFAQSIPTKTLVAMVVTQDFTQKILQSNGGAGLFEVEKDVVVNGKTVIAAKTPINIRMDRGTKTDFKIVIAEIKATDGSTVKIDDCWLYTSIDQNLTGKPKGPVFRKGTRKICYTL
ncbi:MAG: hypothetical protein KF706_00905 [Chitinophagales bacterium]|nr:hypothetical protein [Chitinophagales bacterium]OJV30620.1 MAG: hypothetical protein BGO32_09565 [Bacteroidetes bacterium 37-13]HRP38935.1 hypothetical protein [Chitinophagales bacterium]